MRKGEEIPTSYLEEAKSDLTKLFIQLPQVARVIEKMEERAEFLLDDKEIVVQIVYGEYGHGKSQTAHLVYEVLKVNFTANLVHLEKITSFRRFLENFAASIKNSDSRNIKKAIGDFKSKLSNLENATDGTVSLGELIQELLEISQILTMHEVPVVLLLDEVDKIVHDEKDLKEWIDFFTALNSADEIGLLLSLYLPQKSAQLLLQNDQRMVRWSTYFQMDAIFLTGRYGNKLENGIANILAISSFHHPDELLDADLAYVHEVLDFRKQFLLDGSLREVNIWTTQIAEFISRCSEYNLWGRVDIFSKLNAETQALKLEGKLRVVLAHDELPPIQIPSLDDDENDIYKISYSSEPLDCNGEIVPGYFRVNRVGETEYQEYAIAVHVMFTTADLPSDEQFDETAAIISGAPTIILSLGPPAENLSSIEEEISKRCAPEQYPYVVSNIPLKLIYPLILVPDDEKEFIYLRGLFMIFGTRISDYRGMMEKFFKDLPDFMFERQIRIRTQELIGKKATIVRASAGEVRSKPSDVSDKNLFLATMVSVLESVKRYKQVNVLERQMRKYCETNYISDKELLLANIEGFIKILQKKQMINIQFQNGRDVITKLGGWDSENALLLLQKELN